MISNQIKDIIPIRIGFDAKRYFNNKTGLGNYARWLVNVVSSSSHFDIKLFSPSNQQTGGLEIITPQSFWKHARSLWRISGINRDLVRNKIQVYHGLSNEIPFGIHKTGIRTVVTIHDCINLRYPENYSLFDRYIYKLKLNYAQKYADIIVVPSQQTKEDLLTYLQTNANKIRIIPLSLPPIPNFKIVKKEPFILCVSSFDKRKNLYNLVLAYLQIKSPTYPLIIAGKTGKEFEKIRKLVSNKSSITLLTNLSNDEIHNLYHHAVFSVYPSVFEGFGIPILEAFLHGKAVATSNCSSMPEVGGDAAIYFNPLNVNEIQSAIEHLCDENNRKKIEMQTTEQLKKFDSKRLLALYEGLYIGLEN